MSKTTSYKQPITPLVHGGDSDNGTDSGSSNADSSLSDTPLRTLEVWESAPNADILSHDHLNLQVARSVSSGGSKAFNVVWQSKNIAPSTTISWTSVYALNWHPTEGLSGTLNGVWQPCAFGEVFDLKDKGYWDSSTVQPEAGYMKAGEVNYGYPGVPGIHILLIGIQNDADEFDVIYVDPTSLGLNESVTYQPQESVQWWYQNNTRTATMIKNVTSPMEMREYSQPAPETGKYYYSSTYNYSTGHWITSPRKPGQGLYAPPPPPQTVKNAELHPVYTIFPAILLAVFKKAVGMETEASADLKGFLQVKYEDIEVKFLSDTSLKVKLGWIKRARLNSDDALAVLEDEAELDVSNSLERVKKDGIFA